MRIFSSIKLFYTVATNTIKYNLWKATLRKLFQQVVVDNLSPHVLKWYEEKAISMETFAPLYNLNIDESVISPQMAKITNEREKDNSDKASKRNRMGGFANVPLVFSLVKDMKRSVCLECGVSMGGSSYAILKGLENNESGKLLSSDLPYLWISDPINKIGTLVPSNLRKKWTLFIGDDKDNLPKMLKSHNDIDFVHYDSNKSYQARVFFCNSIMDSLADDCIIMFDDIIDNDHFHDFSKSVDSSWTSYILFDEIKYVGVMVRGINANV
jgi:predicted O-methyltransferase YrrM